MSEITLAAHHICDTFVYYREIQRPQEQTLAAV